MKQIYRLAGLVALLGTAALAVEMPAAGATVKPKAKAQVDLPEDWMDLEESMNGPEVSKMKLDDEIIGSYFIDEVPGNGGFAYGYGGKTCYKLLPSKTPGNEAVFTIYFDNDWAGSNLSVGTTSLDLSKYSKTGTLTFWIKAGPNAKKFMIGIMDNEGNDKKVQTKVNGHQYVALKNGEWVQARIPLKAFSDTGVYWDATNKREIPSKVDWSKIQEFRISINKDENLVEKGKPITFYLDQIQLTKTAKGVKIP